MTELTSNPSTKYAYIVDATSNLVIVVMAIRRVASFEMAIQAARYRPYRLMQHLAATEK